MVMQKNCATNKNTNQGSTKMDYPIKNSVRPKYLTEKFIRIKRIPKTRSFGEKLCKFI